MASNSIVNLLSETMSRIREVVDANTVIGTPIQLQEDVTIVPVTKIAIGMACGGSDFGKDTGNIKFGGGSGSGVTVTPLCFIVCEKGVVRMVSCDSFDHNPYTDVAQAIPVAVEKISEVIKQVTNRSKENEVNE